MKPASRISNRSPAFTLVEMLTVCAIIALLASMAIPRFGNSLTRARADAAARRVVGDLDFARQRALVVGSPRAVSFDPSTDTYTLTGIAHIDHPEATYVVNLSAIPYETDLNGAVFGSGAQVTFDAYGIPSDGGTVTIKAGAETRVVTLDAQTGEATYSGG